MTESLVREGSQRPCSLPTREVQDCHQNQIEEGLASSCRPSASSVTCPRDELPKRWGVFSCPDSCSLWQWFPVLVWGCRAGAWPCNYSFAEFVAHEKGSSNWCQNVLNYVTFASLCFFFSPPFWRWTLLSLFRITLLCVKNMTMLLVKCVQC